MKRFPRHSWNYCRVHAQSFTTECIGCRRERESRSAEDADRPPREKGEDDGLEYSDPRDYRRGLE